MDDVADGLGEGHVVIISLTIPGWLWIHPLNRQMIFACLILSRQTALLGVGDRRLGIRVVIDRTPRAT